MSMGVEKLADLQEEYRLAIVAWQDADEELRRAECNVSNLRTAKQGATQRVLEAKAKVDAEEKTLGLPVKP